MPTVNHQLPNQILIGSDCKYILTSTLLLLDLIFSLTFSNSCRGSLSAMLSLWFNFRSSTLPRYTSYDEIRSVCHRSGCGLVLLRLTFKSQFMACFLTYFYSLWSTFVGLSGTSVFIESTPLPLRYGLEEASPRLSFFWRRQIPACMHSIHELNPGKVLGCSYKIVQLGEIRICLILWYPMFIKYQNLFSSGLCWIHAFMLLRFLCFTCLTNIL